MTAVNEKAAVRTAALKRRDSIDPRLRADKDLLIKTNLQSLPEFVEARVILFFASFRSEVSTLLLIEDALQGGKRIILPRVDSRLKELRLYEVNSTSELRPGFMGIPEPDASDKPEIDINDVDLVVMPGAAFDRAGNRLGYGGGYYDKLLSKMRIEVPLVALAYEEQIVDSLPSEPHDIKVDIIVTDRRVIRRP